VNRKGSRYVRAAAPPPRRTPLTRRTPVTLKTLADYLGLSPSTISLVVNRAPAARAIPRATQERVLAAARRFGYRPNPIARSLQAQRAFTIGVLVPEISEGYAALVMSGIEDYLLQYGYLYFVASHRHRPDLIDEYPRLLLERAVEGLIAVDTPCQRRQRVPVVAVSGHGATPGVTNIVLDHRRAAELALGHLCQLGHRRIAFIKGQAFSSDTDIRWNSIGATAARLDLAIDPALTVQLESDFPSSDEGYRLTRLLLTRGEPFTALFAFNDVSAIGAMQALREDGRRVPEDVSVVGFDDIQSAAYQHPGLTTVRQPLRRMGELAAETVLRRIAEQNRRAYPKQVTVAPELVVRGSTAPATSIS
jgi:DNA-binding LacI/PurR family transcriptional regulator